MELHTRIKKEGQEIYQNLQGSGIAFELSPENKLRILTKTTPNQFEIIRLWKRQIIEALSPECSNCTMPMNLIENGNLWFCGFGCESKETKL